MPCNVWVNFGLIFVICSPLDHYCPYFVPARYKINDTPALAESWTDDGASKLYRLYRHAPPSGPLYGQFIRGATSTAAEISHQEYKVEYVLVSG